MDGGLYLPYLYFLSRYNTLILRYIHKGLLDIDNLYNLAFGHIQFLHGKGRKKEADSVNSLTAFYVYLLITFIYLNLWEGHGRTTLFI